MAPPDTLRRSAGGTSLYSVNNTQLLRWDQSAVSTGGRGAFDTTSRLFKRVADRFEAVYLIAISSG
jgi:hypothetical protein